MVVWNWYYLDNYIIINANIRRKMMFNSYISNTLKYDPKLCINCGMCSTVCPHGVFSSNGKVAQLMNAKACMECGACQLNCPTNAIKVDSGVGCASAMIWAAARGQKEVTCGCGSACCDSKPQVLQIGKKE
jgi:NAD-dependent dihydropyrimidine dehydrogenase PreA subunit